MTVATIWIYTGGYLHDLPDYVVADLAYDLRELRDPAHVPTGELLDMRGDLDPEVRAFVLATRGAPELLGRVVGDVLEELGTWDPELDDEGDLVVTFGCAGGKHRAASFGVFAHAIFTALGFDVKLTHLHAHLPRVIK